MMRVTPLDWHGPPRLVISHQNITKRKQAEEKVRMISRMDGLTGVANRRHFNFFLSNEWRRAARLGKPISLIFLDIDFFKDYNDNYGHQAGDDCLKLVAARIATFGKRPGDLVARYGGEEFAVILADTGSEPAATIAGQIREAVRSQAITHEHSPVDRCVTVSCGVATAYPDRNSSERSLVEKADKAMYAAKQAGRNRVVSGDGDGH